VIVEEGATIEYSIVAENVVVKKQAKIGESKQKANKITVIGSDVTILEDYKVAAGQMIEKDVRK
jgi:glucose-1-phosphate adenylyltransferase